MFGGAHRDTVRTVHQKGRRTSKSRCRIYKAGRAAFVGAESAKIDSARAISSTAIDQVELVIIVISELAGMAS